MLFGKETIKSYSASIGITNIDENAYETIIQDLEYRIKELCQDSAKFMHASHRTRLHIDDINHVLTSRNIDPLFGYDPTESLNFKSINNFFFIPQEECDIEEYLNKPLPKIQARPTIQSHWLAIEGVQPQIPQNPLPTETKQKTTDVLPNYLEDVELNTASKHILSKELQMYFDKICGYINEDDCSVALKCLEGDSGIQQLIPYFIQYFNESIAAKNSKIAIIIAMIFSLLKNKYIFVDPYLHQISPALLTAILGSEQSLETREVAIDTLKYLYDKFAGTYNSLAPKIINTLKKHWLNEKSNENVQLAAIKTLCKLGERVKEDIVIKNITSYKGNNQKVIDFLKEIQ